MALDPLGAFTPDQWSALEAIATIITALVALAAAVFAFIQVRQARTLRLEQSRPFVVVDFDLAPGNQDFIEVVIENLGTTVATDVVVVFHPPLESADKTASYEIGESVLIKRGIPTMPPGRRVTAVLDQAQARYAPGLPLKYEATVTCKDYRGKAQKPLRYVLDLSFRYGIGRIEEPRPGDAVKALVGIEKSMRRWAPNRDGIKVYTVDEDERRFASDWKKRKGIGRTGPMPPPHARPAPSRFDQYGEPIWKRVYWATRLLVLSRGRRRAIEARMKARPDLATFLEPELHSVSGRSLRRLFRAQLNR